MKYFFLFFLALSSFLHAKTEIVVIGDSISTNAFVKEEECYVSLLQEKLEPYEVEVINFSVRGCFIGGGIDLIKYACKYHQPKIAVIALGMNDFLVAAPKATTKDFLGQLIRQCLLHGVTPVLGTLNLSYFTKVRPYPQLPAYIQEFHSAFKDIVTQYDILTFCFLDAQLMNNPQCHVGDWIHPTAQGHVLIAEKLEQVLIPLLDR